MMNLYNLSEQEVLALTIYGEARGESILGQVAVGCVVRNRVTVDSDYRAVCLKKEQFSCWNIADANYLILLDLATKIFNGQPIEDEMFHQCFWVADGIVNRSITDVTHGSKNYMTNKLYEMNKPDWSKNLKVSIVIGNQTFLV